MVRNRPNRRVNDDKPYQNRNRNHGAIHAFPHDRGKSGRKTHAYGNVSAQTPSESKTNARYNTSPDLPESKDMFRASTASSPRSTPDLDSSIPDHCWVGEYLDENDEKDTVPIAYDKSALSRSYATELKSSEKSFEKPGTSSSGADSYHAYEEVFKERPSCVQSSSEIRGPRGASLSPPPPPPLPMKAHIGRGSGTGADAFESQLLSSLRTLLDVDSNNPEIIERNQPVKVYDYGHGNKTKDLASKARAGDVSVALPLDNFGYISKSRSHVASAALRKTHTAIAPEDSHLGSMAVNMRGGSQRAAIRADCSSDRTVSPSMMRALSKKPDTVDYFSNIIMKEKRITAREDTRPDSRRSRSGSSDHHLIQPTSYSGTSRSKRSDSTHASSHGEQSYIDDLKDRRPGKEPRRSKQDRSPELESYSRSDADSSRSTNPRQRDSSKRDGPVNKIKYDDYKLRKTKKSDKSTSSKSTYNMESTHRSRLENSRTSPSGPKESRSSPSGRARVQSMFAHSLLNRRSSTRQTPSPPPHSSAQQKVVEKGDANYIPVHAVAPVAQEFPIKVHTSGYRPEKKRMRMEIEDEFQPLLASTGRPDTTSPVETQLKIKPVFKNFHRPPSQRVNSSSLGTTSGTNEPSTGAMTGDYASRNSAYRGSFNDTRKVLLDEEKESNRLHEETTTKEHRDHQSSRIVVRNAMGNTRPVASVSPVTEAAEVLNYHTRKEGESQKSRYKKEKIHEKSKFVRSEAPGGFPFFKNADDEDSTDKHSDKYSDISDEEPSFDDSPSPDMKNNQKQIGKADGKKVTKIDGGAAATRFSLKKPINKDENQAKFSRGSNRGRFMRGRGGRDTYNRQQQHVFNKKQNIGSVGKSNEVIGEADVYKMSKRQRKKLLAKQRREQSQDFLLQQQKQNRSQSKEVEGSPMMPPSWRHRQQKSRSKSIEGANRSTAERHTPQRQQVRSQMREFAKSSTTQRHIETSRDSRSSSGDPAERHKVYWKFQPQSRSPQSPETEKTARKPRWRQRGRGKQFQNRVIDTSPKARQPSSAQNWQQQKHFDVMDGERTVHESQNVLQKKRLTASQYHNYETKEPGKVVYWNEGGERAPKHKRSWYEPHGKRDDTDKVVYLKSDERKRKSETREFHDPHDKAETPDKLVYWKTEDRKRKSASQEYYESHHDTDSSRRREFSEARDEAEPDKVVYWRDDDRRGESSEELEQYESQNITSWKRQKQHLQHPNVYDKSEVTYQDYHVRHSRSRSYSSDRPLFNTHSEKEDIRQKNVEEQATRVVMKRSPSSEKRFTDRSPTISGVSQPSPTPRKQNNVTPKSPFKPKLRRGPRISVSPTRDIRRFTPEVEQSRNPQDTRIIVSEPKIGDRFISRPVIDQKTETLQKTSEKPPAVASEPKSSWMPIYKLWFHNVLHDKLCSDERAKEKCLQNPLVFLESVTKGNKRSMAYIPRGENAKQMLKFIALNKKSGLCPEINDLSDEVNQPLTRYDQRPQASEEQLPPLSGEKQQSYLLEAQKEMPYNMPIKESEPAQFESHIEQKTIGPSVSLSGVERAEVHNLQMDESPPQISNVAADERKEKTSTHEGDDSLVSVRKQTAPKDESVVKALKKENVAEEKKKSAEERTKTAPQVCGLQHARKQPETKKRPDPVAKPKTVPTQKVKVNHSNVKKKPMKSWESSIVPPNEVDVTTRADERNRLGKKSEKSIEKAIASASTSNSYEKTTAREKNATTTVCGKVTNIRSPADDVEKANASNISSKSPGTKTYPPLRSQAQDDKKSKGLNQEKSQKSSGKIATGQKNSASSESNTPNQKQSSKKGTTPLKAAASGKKGRTPSKSNNILAKGPPSHVKKTSLEKKPDFSTRSKTITQNQGAPEKSQNLATAKDIQKTGQSQQNESDGNARADEEKSERKIPLSASAADQPTPTTVKGNQDKIVPKKRIPKDFPPSEKKKLTATIQPSLARPENGTGQRGSRDHRSVPRRPSLEQSKSGKDAPQESVKSSERRRSSGSRLSSFESTSSRASERRASSDRNEYIRVPKSKPRCSESQERLLSVFKQHAENKVIRNLNVLYKFENYRALKIEKTAHDVLNDFHASDCRKIRFTMDHAIYHIWELFQNPTKHMLDAIEKRLRRVHLDKPYFSVDAEALLLFQRTVFQLCYELLKPNVKFYEQAGKHLRYIRLFSEYLFPQFHGESNTMIRLWTWSERIYWMLAQDAGSGSARGSRKAFADGYSGCDTLESSLASWLKDNIKGPLHEYSEVASCELVKDVDRQSQKRESGSTKQMAMMLIIRVWTESHLPSIKSFTEKKSVDEPLDKDDSSTMEDLVILDEVYSDDTDSEPDKVEFEVDVSDEISSISSVQIIDLF